MINIGGDFDFDGKASQIKELENEMNHPDFWNDPDQARQVSSKVARLKRESESWKKMKQDIEDTAELLDLVSDENDEDTLSEIEESFQEMKGRFAELESLHFLSKPMDDKNCYLAIHSGAGGTESCDWADMLFRMYARWTERKEFGCHIIDRIDGEEAGVKSITLHIIGHNAYGLLRNEIGVHRLVRISPFDSGARRHTSFASVDCTPEIDESIDVNIDEKDLKIDTYRSQGAGGQHVNTTDSAVRITHQPTGVVVTCQNERSQIKNRATAMKLLRAKLYTLEEEKRRQELEAHNVAKMDIAWGSQIRSYVFHPYTMVKDHRTNMDIGNGRAVMDGDIDPFIYEYMRYQAQRQDDPEDNVGGS